MVAEEQAEDLVAITGVEQSIAEKILVIPANAHGWNDYHLTAVTSLRKMIPFLLSFCCWLSCLVFRYVSLTFFTPPLLGEKFSFFFIASASVECIVHDG